MSNIIRRSGYNSSGQPVEVPIGINGESLQVTTAGAAGTTVGKIALFDDGTTGKTLMTVATSTGLVSCVLATNVVTFTFAAGFTRFEWACAQLDDVAIGAYAVAVINAASGAAAEGLLTHTMNSNTGTDDRLILLPGQQAGGLHGYDIKQVDIAAVRMTTAAATGDRAGLVVSWRVAA